MIDLQDEATQPEAEVVAETKPSESTSVRDLATAAGLFPETVKGNGRRSILFNHRFWQLKVAMERQSWTLDSQTTQQEFDAAIQDAAGATAR
jgi:hypothetical protein